MKDYISIDTKKYELKLEEQNYLIYQYSYSKGIELPCFCYNENLEIAGNCRICLIEIEKMPKLMLACATKVGKNMVIKTKNKRLERVRKSIMEFLLINHPLDCRAPFNLYVRWVKNLSNLSVYLNNNIYYLNNTVKQQTNLVLGQPTGDHSMSVKDLIKNLSYIIYVEDYELELILSAKIKRSYCLLYLIKIINSNKWFQFDYGMLGSPSIITDNNWTTWKDHVKDSKRLSIIKDVYIKNLGSSDISNNRRWRKLRSKFNIERYYTTNNVFNNIDSQLKEVRNDSDLEVKPAGIMELSTLFKNKNFDNIMKYVKDINNLKIAYKKVVESSSVTYGKDSLINDEFFAELNKELGTGLYKCHPSKRIYIKKTKGGLRPLSIPSFKDKIVQESIKIVIEPIFDYIFFDESHGFRPERSAHTALLQIRSKFTSVKWFIEGDIKACFDSFDHKMLIEVLTQYIKDPLFIQTLYKILKAGYIYNGNWFKSVKGVPQCSILGPLLSNIYLYRLDYEIVKLREQFNKGSSGSSRVRKRNPEYTKNKKYNKELLYNINPFIFNDSRFKRLFYVRYADDFLIGVIGSKEDCIILKNQIYNILIQINLQLNQEKTKIKHASLEGTLFLGYYIRITPQDQDKKPIKYVERNGIRYKTRINTKPQLIIPFDYIINKLKEKKIVRHRNNKKIVGTAVNIYITYDLARIVFLYNALFKGISNYYILANNYYSLHYINYLLWCSCALTIAKKLKLRTISKVIKKFGFNLIVDKNIKYNYKIIRKRNKNKLHYIQVGNYDFDKWINIYLKRYYKVNKLLKSECKICYSKKNLTIHHINKLSKDILDTWVQLYQIYNRKQIVLCSECHWKIHIGKYDNNLSYKKLL